MISVYDIRSLGKCFIVLLYAAFNDAICALKTLPGCEALLCITSCLLSQVLYR